MNEHAPIVYYLVKDEPPYSPIGYFYSSISAKIYAHFHGLTGYFPISIQVPPGHEPRMKGFN